MKDCTFYDLLGVPMDASDKEITEAKNFLVKKFHPDANIDCGFDTTPYVQNVLAAYKILIDPETRRVYDRRIRNPLRRRDYGSKGETKYSGPMSPNFAPYWEAANKLNELVNEGAAMLKARPFSKKEPDTDRLTILAEEAYPHVRLLEDGEIPRRYWVSHAINWLLFQWSQNRDLPYLLLYSMYDSYLEQCKSGLEKRKLTGQADTFLHTLDKLIAYRQIV